MFWEKRCSYKQLFWKLPEEILSQNPWKISLKKFIFSEVAQSCSRKFLPKKEIGKKHNFHKFLYLVKTSGNVTETATLVKMNFFIGIFQEFLLQISEHLFFRTPLKWQLLQRRIQDLVRHLRRSFFVIIVNGFKPLTIFTREASS